jgi:hypothetical protein
VLCVEDGMRDTIVYKRLLKLNDCCTSVGVLILYTRLKGNKYTNFNIHGTVFRSMTSSNNQRDAA